ncbi:MULTISPECIES: ABC transporter permease [Actinomycetaceae]|jgi:proline/glycine betaine ABC transporter, permease protein|uniref:ABC transporter permease n=1 Tax=Actinomycetaceae TaxID=2049 RepID=UPI0003971C7B|nr:ABC transporter permease [Actinobaculum sp. oral taxon 183]ERH16967.1 ABC transporter, permease protein [Actinobaculum sp. oral taxon 183 str. F0552]RKV68114.1 MAG: ABC transporter permease [Actinomyces sp.]
MNYLRQAFSWLTDSSNWSGASGIPARIGEHLLITAIVVGLAAAIAVPVGVLVGHTRRGAAAVGAVTGAARSIPTLGLLTVFGLAFGIGLKAPVLALVILAIPSLLAGTYAGIQAIDPAIPSAAKAVGMSPAQVIGKVEIPLALPVIVGGIRAAVLQVIATATLAAYISDTGLGRYLFSGLKSRDYTQMLGGAFVVILLALLMEVILASLQRAATRIADPTGK